MYKRAPARAAGPIGIQDRWAQRPRAGHTAPKNGRRNSDLLARLLSNPIKKSGNAVYVFKLTGSLHGPVRWGGNTDALAKEARRLMTWNGRAGSDSNEFDCT
jgi:hypothetical protein